MVTSYPHYPQYPHFSPKRKQKKCSVEIKKRRVIIHFALREIGSNYGQFSDFFNKKKGVKFV